MSFTKSLSDKFGINCSFWQIAEVPLTSESLCGCICTVQKHSKQYSVYLNLHMKTTLNYTLTQGSIPSQDR